MDYIDWEVLTTQKKAFRVKVFNMKNLYTQDVNVLQIKKRKLRKKIDKKLKTVTLQEENEVFRAEAVEDSKNGIPSLQG